MQTRSRVLSNGRLTESCWSMKMAFPQGTSDPEPGQFISLRLGEHYPVLFRRPFSVFRSTRQDSGALEMEIVYRVVGRGTRFMTRLNEDHHLDVIGPLGRGFQFRSDRPYHVLLAGGIGAASLFMLGRRISVLSKGEPFTLHVLIGARTRTSVVLEKEFHALDARVRVSTDDASYGYGGSVIDMFRDTLDNNEIPPDAAVYSCGPEPMLRTLAGFCREHGLDTQVAMERPMMCGIGACLACVCKVDKANIMKSRDLTSSHVQLDPEQDFGYALVCKDGPVFDIKELVFDG